jgi:hypothetical protein
MLSTWVVLEIPMGNMNFEWYNENIGKDNSGYSFFYA